MKILLEDTIPFGTDYLNSVGQVETYAWQSLVPEMLCDVDILALRSTTKVTPELLTNANKLKFVTTATAGTNHLDKIHLDKVGIAHSSAAGCNAVAVAEYVLSVLLHAQKAQKLGLYDATVGIVGAGNVGSALSRILTAIDVKHCLYDPPLQQALARTGKTLHNGQSFVDLAQIAKCDVISLHVPFIKDGDYPTYQMIDQTFLEALTSDQLLINACRGEVIDEEALLNLLQQEQAPTVVLDVFDNEPAINTALFDHVWFVTPHIAGHSVEGKVRGTQMIYEQICEVVGTARDKELSDFLDKTNPINAELASPEASRLSVEDLTAVFHKVYDVAIDDEITRNAFSSTSKNNEKTKSDVANTFSALRKQYRVRRECSAYALQLPKNTSKQIQNTFTKLGFSVSLV
ncbi:erythronate-4-phosphate dehydrogenase [Alteromonas mediterranea]|uniref:4-phosphoerythronate dehydrogenase n=1 Tax=Alteromonas mediterranea TaxID=314275 RepID=UPI000903F3FE|nr:4-phosphoerythronate dehydrogenase [Alteromonas mediterranea]APD94533.1 erythronate-4-phosphate dehydrogenase [Alteromonas mediterranea]APD98165.1 erythronate-4-phosphate dehydrogenase [Alteromonas mediterranea]QDG35338.1 4-phosphoerythronate dehydrogenase [Alteromonas mediterranea]